MAIEKDTKQILTEGEKIQDFVKSDGWQIVRKKLVDKLVLLDSIAAMPKEGSDATIVKQLKIREGVNSIITEWLNDLEGLSEQHSFNTAKFLEIEKKNAIVQNFE